MRHNPASGAIVIMLRALKMYGMAQAVDDLIEQGSPAFDTAVPILSQLLKPVLSFNARVEYSTSKSDFQLEELRRKRISLYLAAIPADLEMLSPLYNLIFQQVIDRNTRALPEQGGGEAFKGDKELIDRMTQVARVGIGEELAHGRVFKPQMAAAQPMESIAKPKPPKETLRRPRMN